MDSNQVLLTEMPIRVQWTECTSLFIPRTKEELQPFELSTNVFFLYIYFFLRSFVVLIPSDDFEFIASKNKNKNLSTASCYFQILANGLNLVKIIIIIKRAKMSKARGDVLVTHTEALIVVEIQHRVLAKAGSKPPTVGNDGAYHTSTNWPRSDSDVRVHSLPSGATASAMTLIIPVCWVE